MPDSAKRLFLLIRLYLLMYFDLLQICITSIYICIFWALSFKASEGLYIWAISAWKKLPDCKYFSLQKYLQPWKPFISNLSAVYPVSTTFRIRIFHNRQGILLFSLRRATQLTNWVLFAMDTWMIIQVWTMCKHYTDYRNQTNVEE